MIVAPESSIRTSRMTDRIPIPDERAAEVLFASDKTCCVCRTEKKVQILHIEGDSSNNDFVNLAVLCLLCHSETETKGGFVRRMTPEVIRLYNTSWRKIVQLKLNPAKDADGKLEYLSEVFLEASLDCHSWKLYYFDIRGVPLSSDKKHDDVWDMLIDKAQHQYSQETYSRFKPLFSTGLDDVKRRFDRVVHLYSDILPFDFRTILLRAYRQLDTEQRAYPILPPLFERLGGPDHALFNGRFKEVFRILRNVAREADKRREAIVGEEGSVA